MGANFGDLDNDGRLDFYIGTGDPQLMNLMPNRMFRQGEDGRFQDVTTSGGFGQLQKGHGIAFGDLDNDGDQDIYSVVGGAAESDGYPDQLFANPGHGNSWLKLRLVGVQSNRAAIGARVKVVAKYENGDVREFHRTVGSGGSFGASPLRVEVGLGKAVAIDRIEVFWPVSDKRQTFTNPEINQSYRVTEGSTDLVAWELPAFELGVMADGSQLHHHQ
jgi:hypothetical protein